MLLTGIMFLINTEFVSAQTEYQARGVTSVCGLIYPKEKDYQLSCNKVLVDFDGFEPYASFRVMAELENQSRQIKKETLVMPIYLFFTEFHADHRSSILTNLQKIFPEVFDLSIIRSDMKNDLKKPFEQRDYYKQFISPAKLSLLHINQIMLNDEQYLDILKAEATVMWVTEGNNKFKDKEALLVRLNLYFDMEFEPYETKTFKGYFQVPSYYCGINSRQHYAPFVLGTGKNWRGKIEKIFILNNNFNSRLVLPTGMDAELLNYREEHNLTVISDYQPRFWDRVAFYNISETRSLCDNTRITRAIMPYGVTGIKASSALDGSAWIRNMTTHFVENVAFASSIEDFNSGSLEELSLFQNQFTERFMNYPYFNLLENNCRQERSYLRLKSQNHPLFAFDISEEFEKQEEQNYYKRTCWCENVDGNGSGEWIEFTLKQPVTAIKLWNGNQFSETSFEEYGRVRSFTITNEDGSIEKKFPGNDIMLQNIYQVHLEPGTYRLTINKTYAGKGEEAITCLSAIRFNFAYDDEWLNQAYLSLSTQE